MRIDLPHPPQRVLLIKPSSLGDIVHALPMLGLLKRRWPDTRISWLVMPAFVGLLEGHPLIDELLLFERRRLASFWRDPSAAARLMALTRTLRQRRFDLVIDLQGLLRSGWLTWRSGAAHRVGFAHARELAWLFYNHRVPIHTVEQHALDRNLAIAGALGCDHGPVEFIFPPHDAEREQISAIVPSEPFAVLLPAANWLTKRWPVEHYAALVEPLRDRFGLRTVVAGGADAIDLGKQIPGGLDLTGKTTLKQLIALLERADLVIANDSGPMHIAAALGRPLVTLFGPTNPVRTGPYGRLDAVLRVNKPCSPCYSRSKRRCGCLAEITPEQVLAAWGEGVRNRGNGTGGVRMG